MANIGPCKDCTYRYPGCHDKCTRGYKEWAAEFRAISERRKAENMGPGMVTELKKRAVDKWYRRTRK